MTTIDIGVILVFTLLVFICGMSFAKSGKNMKSFFAAGGALPWWMSGLSLFMSFFSAGTFVVWGSIAYSSGWVAVTIQWTMCIAGLVIGFWIAPKWQKTKALTAAEYIKDRLGYNVQRTYTYIFLAISSFSTGAFLYPVAKIVEVGTGIPISISVIVLGLLILIYTAVGGLWAVIVTDILQFVVLTAVVLIVVPLAFDKVGGVVNFIEQAPKDFFSFVSGEYTWAFILGFGLYNLTFIAGNWAYVQRYTSVATPKDAKKVGWIFGALYFISPLIWMLPPMIYRMLNPELGGLADEGAYLLICKEVLPVGMLGLMLGAMIFATSSSVNTTLNLSAGVIANDVYKHFKPSASDQELVRVGRISTLILGLITIVVALLMQRMGGIVSFVFTVAALTGGALFLPPIWALFSKYQTGKSVLTITVVTLAVNIYFKFISPSLFDFALDGPSEQILGVFLPATLLMIYEIYARINKTDISQYLKHLEIVEQKILEVGQQDDRIHDEDNSKGARVISYGIAATGSLIIGISIIAKHHILVIAGMGVLILLLGLFILLKNKTRISTIK